MTYLSPASLPSSLTCYPSAQQLYPLAPHALHNPSIPNLQSFMPFFSHTSLLSGPSWPISAQHPYPPVSHAILQPSIPTFRPSCPLHNPSIPNLQSFMPFFRYTSLLSGHSCPPSAQHPYPPVTHEMPSLSPSIPTLQSLAAYFNPAFSELCNPTLRSLLPSLNPACSLKLL